LENPTELARGRELSQEQQVRQVSQRQEFPALQARQQRVLEVLQAPRPAFQEESWFPIEPIPRK